MEFWDFEDGSEAALCAWAYWRICRMIPIIAIQTQVQQVRARVEGLFCMSQSRAMSLPVSSHFAHFILHQLPLCSVCAQCLSLILP